MSVKSLKKNVNNTLQQGRKFLTTGGTAVWFFPSMAGLVLEKLSVCVEGLSTLVTCEGFICCVGSLVLLKVAQVIKS